MVNDKKRAATVRQLKDALMQLFQEYDFQKITVTMLCRKAGLHRSTFYFYYSNTDELLREIEHDILNEIQKYSDRMNMFEKPEKGKSLEEIYKKNEQIMIDFYYWQFSMRDYLNPLLGAYGDPYFIIQYEKIIRINTLPALELLGYNEKENPYVLKYVTGGILKTNQDWLLNNDISVEEIVHLQRTMVYENPFVRKG